MPDNTAKDANEARLLAVFRKLAPDDRHALQAYAEFLAVRSGALGEDAPAGEPTCDRETAHELPQAQEPTAPGPTDPARIPSRCRERTSQEDCPRSAPHTAQA